MPANNAPMFRGNQLAAAVYLGTRRLWARPETLSLDFAADQYKMGGIAELPATRQFSDLITFTRASGGGRFNASGQYEWLPANTPRIDYDPVTGECRGLLIEESRTNLLAQSDNPSVSPWLRNNLGVSGNTITETMGFFPRDVCPNSPSGANNTAFVAGVTYTAVAAVRPKQESAKRYIQLALPGGVFPVNARRAKFDIETGTVTWRDDSSVIATVTMIGNICVCRITATAATSGTGYGIAVGLHTAPIGALAAYEGDGTSGIELLYADLQVGAFPTSHIPTTTAQVTRAADIASVNELSPWFNPEQGTLVVEATSIAPGFRQAAGFPQGTYNGFRLFRTAISAQRLAFNTEDGSGTNTLSAAAASGSVKMAGSYSAGGCALSVNGTPSVSLSAARSGFSPTSLQIGRYAVGEAFWSGHIRSIRVYPIAFPEAELQALSA